MQLMQQKKKFFFPVLGNNRSRDEKKRELNCKSSIGNLFILMKNIAATSFLTSPRRKNQYFRKLDFADDFTTKLIAASFPPSRCRFPKISICFIDSPWNPYTNRKYYILFLDDPKICNKLRTNSKKVGR